MTKTSVRFSLAVALGLLLATALGLSSLRAAPASPTASPSPETATTPIPQPAGGGKTVQGATAALAKVQTLLEFYYMETGQFPETLEDMVAQYNQGVKQDQPPVTLPTDPATGKKLVYEPTADRSGYTLRVPDPGAYGVDQLSIKQVDWGWMNQLALEQKKRRQMMTCARYMELLAQVVNQYNKDNRNKFPDSLDQLVPKYVKKVPACPVSLKPYLYKHDERGFEVGCPDPAAHGLEVFRFSSTEGLKRYP